MVVAPLLLAFFIYISFRNESILINILIRKTFLKELFLDYRNSIFPLHSSLPQYICYSLPAALWLFSSLNLMFLLWKFEINRYNIIWYAIPILYCLLLEIIQMNHITDGTFDPMDLLFYSIAKVLFLVIHKTKIIRHSKIESITGIHLKASFTSLLLIGIVIFSDCF